jgi:ABC-type phosphate transport system substrate-binding protein
VAKYSEVQQLRLNGREADIETVKQRAYPFFAVEYFYTYGEPQSDTLLSAFLDYMNSATTKNILRRDGYTPCLDGPSNLMGTLCQ